jgi:Flp pilus assembly protein TadG
MRRIGSIMRRAAGALAGLHADRRGSGATLLAFAAVPLVAAIGLSVDGARGWLVKSRLSQAIDAAGLAGGRVIAASTRDDDIRMFFAANFPSDFMKAQIDGPHIDVDPELTTITINARATIPTTFMRVVGIDQITVRADTVVKRMDRGMELVLVMDNTGSMHRTAGGAGGTAKITAMKDAATLLINRLYGSRETVPTLWVGLVPYAAIVNVGTANIGWTVERTSTVINVTAATLVNNEDSSATGTVCVTTAGHPFWDGAIVDISGANQAVYNGRHLIRTVNTAAQDGSPTECSITAGQSNLKFWFVIEGRASGAGAVAQPTGTIQVRLPPTDYTQAVNQAGAAVGWAGCVEARVGGNLEEEQAVTLPTSAATRWVRAFWPSTRNVKFFNVNKRRVPRYDPPLAGPTADVPTAYSVPRDGDNDWGFDMTPKVAEVVWDYFAYGPNFGCPSAVTALQQNKSTVLSAIAAMQPIGRSGTMANVGLAWGWRVIDPGWRGQWSGAPANLPLDYNTPLMSKVVILLTDGANLWSDQGDVAPGRSGISSAGDNDSGLPVDGDYTAYGRLAERRLGSTITNTTQAKTEINSRMSRLCTAMRAQGIIVYTIVLEETDSATQELYRNCASTPHSAYAYFSPTEDELAGIFSEIATQLANLRLAQ